MSCIPVAHVLWVASGLYVCRIQFLVLHLCIYGKCGICVCMSIPCFVAQMSLVSSNSEGKEFHSGVSPLSVQTEGLERPSPSTVLKHSGTVGDIEIELAAAQAGVSRLRSALERAAGSPHSNSFRTERAAERAQPAPLPLQPVQELQIHHGLKAQELKWSQEAQDWTKQSNHILDAGHDSGDDSAPLREGTLTHSPHAHTYMHSHTHACKGQCQA